MIRKTHTKGLSALRGVVAMAMMMAPVVVLSAGSPASAAGPPVFINEIHYDNDGTDADEAIEIAGPAGTDLTGWSVVLYNGVMGPCTTPSHCRARSPTSRRASAR